LARTTYNDILSVGVCPEMRPVGVTKKRKKDRNIHASTGYLPRPPTSTQPPVREVAIYFKYHENRSRCVSERWGFENRLLPLIWPMAYATACTTVQTVMLFLGLDSQLLSHANLRIGLISFWVSILRISFNTKINNTYFLMHP